MQKELTVTLRTFWVWMFAVAMMIFPVFGAAQQPSTAIQPGMIAWSTSSCPSGWTEYTTAQGRALVGVRTDSSFTLEGTVGTALSAEENRVVGQHTHSMTDTPHNHSVTDPGHTHPGQAQLVTLASGDPINGALQLSGSRSTDAASAGITVNAAGANVTINNDGGTANTNAPYIELRTCKKN